jgi:hypothetical protein
MKVPNAELESPSATIRLAKVPKQTTRIITVVKTIFFMINKFLNLFSDPFESQL